MQVVVGVLMAGPPRAVCPCWVLEIRWVLCLADVLGPLLRGGEPLQAAAHLLGEDH